MLYKVIYDVECAGLKQAEEGYVYAYLTDIPRLLREKWNRDIEILRIDLVSKTITSNLFIDPYTKK